MWRCWTPRWSSWGFHISRWDERVRETTTHLATRRGGLTATYRRVNTLRARKWLSESPGHTDAWVHHIPFSLQQHTIHRLNIGHNSRLSTGPAGTLATHLATHQQ